MTTGRVAQAPSMKASTDREASSRARWGSISRRGTS